MPEQDILEQLDSYGAWLEQSSATSLRPTSATGLASATLGGHLARKVTGVVVELNAHRQRRSNSRLFWIPLVIAASLLTFVLTRRSGQPDQSATATINSPSLFVIVNGLAEYEPLNASVQTSAINTEGIESSALVGIRKGESFDHLTRVIIAVNVSPSATDAIELHNGPARIGRLAGMTRIAQQRHGKWIMAMVNGDREADAMKLVESIELASSGQLDLTNTGGYEIAVQTNWKFELTARHNTYLELHRRGTEKYVLVETAVSDLSILFTSDRIVPTTVNDREGWVSTRIDADGVYNSLAWQVAPAQIIVVSAHNNTVEELRRVAESLEVVDEATWKLANPGYTESPN